MPKDKTTPPQDDQTPPEGSATPGTGDGTPPPQDDPQDPPGAGTTPRRTLRYSTPEDLPDGRIRVRASDGQGNTLTVTADDRAKAQASLRAGFKALHGDD